MQIPRVPQRNPDRLVATGLMVGLPALLLVFQGAPLIPTVLVAAAIAGILLIVH